MSKESALRAMREARYNQRAAGAAKPQAASRTATPAVRAEVTKAEVPVAPVAEDDGALCGHKSMNGRTCTREKGHSAKNHRYS